MSINTTADERSAFGKNYLEQVLLEHSERFRKVTTLHKKMTGNMHEDRVVRVSVKTSEKTYSNRLAPETLITYIKLGDFRETMLEQIFAQVDANDVLYELNSISEYSENIDEYKEVFKNALNDTSPLNLDDVPIPLLEKITISTMEKEWIRSLELRRIPLQTSINITILYQSNFDLTNTKKYVYVLNISDFQTEIISYIKNKTVEYYQTQIESIKFYDLNTFRNVWMNNLTEGERGEQSIVYYLVPNPTEDGVVSFVKANAVYDGENINYEVTGTFDCDIWKFIDEAISAFENNGFIAKPLIFAGNAPVETGVFIKHNPNLGNGITFINDDKVFDIFGTRAKKFSANFSFHKEQKKQFVLAFRISMKDQSITFNEFPSAVDSHSMTGHEFEQYCASLLRSNGYTDVDVTQASGDQGIDIIAYHNGIKIGIQCKYYSGSVGNDAIQEAFSGKNFYDCHVAVVMTNSTFTKSAISLAEKNKVVLWDCLVLKDLENKAIKS